jgi:colanic acid biosynthesis glycosyl transferase WcaI
MGNRLLIIGYNFAPEPTGIGKYSGEMVYWLADHGFSCSVITTYPYYPFWKINKAYRNKRYWYNKEILLNNDDNPISVYRCPAYIPSRPKVIKRIILDLSFFITAFLQLLLLLPKKRFDIVITVAPPFHVGLLGVFYKKYRKAKHLHHMQDLQIEAARDLKMFKSKKMINALLHIEKYIFNHSDVISSISENMIQKIREKSQKEVLFFPNWTDTSFFHPLNNKDQLKIDFGFKPTNKIIMYSGAIGEKQGLESIVFVAQKFRSNKDIIFIICGSGPYKKELVNLANSLKLKNIRFLPIQSLDNFNQFLNIADLHLIIQKANASDLVMPSKLNNILAVGGISLTTANKGSSLYTLISKNKMGYLIKTDDQDALYNGILESTRNDNKNIKINAREYAENHLTIDKLMGNLESILSDIIKSHNN